MICVYFIFFGWGFPFRLGLGCGPRLLSWSLILGLLVIAIMKVVLLDLLCMLVLLFNVLVYVSGFLDLR